MDIGHWTSDIKIDESVIEDNLGFVYVITNLLSGKKYIGQKKFWKTSTKPPLKGKLRKRKITVQSDWRDYTGSSNSLNADIASHGKANFKFEILKLCPTKWEMTYYEYKRIIDDDAILNDRYYNEFLGRVGRSPNNLRYFK